MTRKLPNKFRNFVVPSDHVDVILTMLSIKPTGNQSDVPTHILLEYIRAKQYADRINMTLASRDLLQIVCRANEAQQVEDPAKLDVKQLVRSKEIKRGDILLCKWRKEEKPAQFIMMSGDDVTVLIFGDPQERRIHFTKTRPCPEDYDLDGYLETVEELAKV